MANSILSGFFSNPSFVLKPTSYGSAVAASMKIISVDIKFVSTPMRHMREDGTTRVDTRIIRAAELEVSFICPDINTFQQILNVVKDRQQTYSITTRGLHLRRMMVCEDAVKQIPEMLSATPMQLYFKQLLVQNEDPKVCAQAADSSLIDLGLTTISSAASSASSLYSNIQSNISKVF